MPKMCLLITYIVEEYFCLLWLCNNPYKKGEMMQKTCLTIAIDEDARKLIDHYAGKLGRPKTARQAQFSCPECGPRHHIPVPVSVPIRFRGA